MKPAQPCALVLGLVLSLSLCDSDRCQAQDGGGVYANAELLLLRPFETDEDTDSDTDGNGYYPAPRITLGYTASSGVGGRARWFYYGNDWGSDLDQRLSTIDGELFSNFNWGQDWSGTFSGGLRWARFREGTGIEDDLDEAYGPIIGFELRRAISDNLGMYAGVREAILVGNGPDGTSSHSRAAMATELQLGLQMQRNISGRARVFGRAGIEGQHWDGHAVDPDDADAQTLGLFGGVFSVGIDY